MSRPVQGSRRVGGSTELRSLAFGAAALLVMAAAAGCDASEDDCPPQVVHVGNVVEVAGYPRDLQLGAGGTPVTLRAFRWLGRTVVPVPVVAPAMQGKTLDIRELDGRLVRKIVPVAHHVAGQPGEKTLAFIDSAERFLELDLPAAPGAQGEDVHRRAQEALRTLLPQLRAMVLQARQGPVAAGSFGSAALSLDLDGLKLIDRLVVAAGEPVVPLDCRIGAIEQDLSVEAIRSTVRDVAKAVVISAVIVAVLPETAVVAVISGAAQVTWALVATNLALAIGTSDRPLADVWADRAKQAMQDLGAGISAGARTLADQVTGPFAGACVALKQTVNAWTGATDAHPEPQDCGGQVCGGGDTCRVCGAASSCAPADAECCGGAWCTADEECVAGACQAKPGQCSSQQTAGGDAPETREVELGRSSGTFAFQYQTYTQADRMQVLYEGAVLFDTGCVGSSGTSQLSYSGTDTRVTVSVTPNCAGGSGTAWDFVVDCPQ